MNRSDRERVDASDVIEGVLRWRAGDEPPEIVRRDIYRALADAGFRVTPIPDDNTRALAARLHEHADHTERYPPRTFGHDPELVANLRAAAALLDGQPQDRPEQCPTCEIFPWLKGDPYRTVDGCPDPWHVGQFGGHT